MTEAELKEIEARLPKGADRVGTHLDASQLAAALRNAWRESAELRQSVLEVRNAAARAAEEAAAASALAQRYKAERDDLVERCGHLRKTMAQLLSSLQSGPEGDLILSDILLKARNLLDAS